MLTISGNKLISIFFFFYFWGPFLVTSGSAPAEGALMGGWGSKGTSGVCGHIWGTTGSAQTPEQWSTAGARWSLSTRRIPPLTRPPLSSSAGIVTWGTYWKFWLARIWNRSPIFSWILKVSLFHVIELSWYRSHECLPIPLSALKLESPPPPLIFNTMFFPAAREWSLPQELLRFPSTCPFHVGMCAEYQSGQSCSRAPSSNI